MDIDSERALIGVKFFAVGSQRGFATLAIPIIISLIVGLYTYGLQTTHINQAKVKARQMAFADLNQIGNRLLLTLNLNYRHVCQLNFKGKVFASTSSGLSANADNIVIADLINPTLPGNQILTLGQKYGAFAITSIELRRYSPVEPASRSYYGTLAITAADNRHEVYKVIPAYVTMNSLFPEQINDCSLTQMVSNTTTFEDEFCRIKGYGDKYDPSNPAACVTATTVFNFSTTGVPVPTGSD